jgi:hypothetical protein
MFLWQIDLRGFSDDATKIAIDLFLSELEGRGNPYLKSRSF